jgi:hypothetical protein
LSEGTLTELKSTSDFVSFSSRSYLFLLAGGCVSNETLAALAIELNLDRFLDLDNETLAINLRLYRQRIEKAKATEFREAEAEQRPLRPYWLTLDPPKVRRFFSSLSTLPLIDSFCLRPSPTSSRVSSAPSSSTRLSTRARRSELSTPPSFPSLTSSSHPRA